MTTNQTPIPEPTSLTEEQREAIRQLVAHWEGDPGEPDSMESVHFRSLFPDVFPDPTGGDPVVVCTHETAALSVPHFRNDDGTWSFTGRSGNGWRTDQLRNVRRLNPETIADLMDGGLR